MVQEFQTGGTRPVLLCPSGHSALIGLVRNGTIIFEKKDPKFFG